MRTSLSVLTTLFISLLVVGCNQNPDRSTTQEDGVQLVQAADGSLYSVSCLRTTAQTIQSSGGAALNSCKVNYNTSGENTVEAGRLAFGLGSNYAWVWYPPTYYNPSYTSYSYGSNYSPYSDTNYSNNLFCSYLFGGNYNFNCYYMFGYTNSNYSSYSSYYNPSCGYCIYSPTPNRCRNVCYTYSSVY